MLTLCNVVLTSMAVLLSASLYLDRDVYILMYTSFSVFCYHLLHLLSHLLLCGRNLTQACSQEDS